MQKVFDFACAAAYVLGTIGGVAYLLCFHKPLFAVAVAAVAAMAFPYVRDRVKELLG